MFFMVLGMMGGGGGGGEAKLTRCMSLLLLVGEELDFAPLGGPTEGKLAAADDETGADTTPGLNIGVAVSPAAIVVVLESSLCKSCMIWWQLA